MTIKLDFDGKVAKMGKDRVIYIPRAFRRTVHEKLEDREYHIKVEIE